LYNHQIIFVTAQPISSLSGRYGIVPGQLESKCTAQPLPLRRLLLLLVDSHSTISDLTIFAF